MTDQLRSARRDETPPAADTAPAAGTASRPTLYERLGGAGPIEAVVGRFYEGVAVDPVLRRLYPDDLEGAKERLAAFLVQLAGGPRLYEELRGEPRLRQRHLGFPIGTAEATAWLERMGAALGAVALPEEVAGELRTYFERTAAFLVNQGGLSLRGGTGGGAGRGGGGTGGAGVSR